MSMLSLEIITPKGSAVNIKCSSAQFNVCDDLKGKSGGSYGVHPGHAKAVFAIEKGSVKAFRSDTLVLNGECGEGFATVEKNCLKLVVESFAEC